MKKSLLGLLVFGFLLSTLAFAQPTLNMKQDQMGSSEKKEKMPKAQNIKGKISDDGKSFTADKDGKSWNIVNPDAVKGHEGHHVVLNAHVYADKGEVHVMSVKMMADKKEKKDKM
jgi:hypothetical protein